MFALLLGILRRGAAAAVQIGPEGIQVPGGWGRRRRIPLDAVTLVYTSLAPRDDDFREVLVIEHEGAEGPLVLDLSEERDPETIVAALREAFGERWDDVYIGYKHLSPVRGGP